MIIQWLLVVMIGIRGLKLQPYSMTPLEIIWTYSISPYLPIILHYWDMNKRANLKRLLNHSSLPFASFFNDGCLEYLSRDDLVRLHLTGIPISLECIRNVRWIVDQELIELLGAEFFLSRPDIELPDSILENEDAFVYLLRMTQSETRILQQCSWLHSPVLSESFFQLTSKELFPNVTDEPWSILHHSCFNVDHEMRSPENMDRSNRLVYWLRDEMPADKVHTLSKGQLARWIVHLLLIYIGTRKVYGPVYCYPILSALKEYIHELLNEQKIALLLNLAEVVMGDSAVVPDFAYVIIMMASDVISVPKMARWTLALVELWGELEEDIGKEVAGLLVRSIEEVSDYERIYWIDRYLENRLNLQFLRPILSKTISDSSVIQDVLLSRTPFTGLEDLLDGSLSPQRRLLEARKTFFDAPNPTSARISRIWRKSYSETSVDMYNCAVNHFAELGGTLKFDNEIGKYHIALMRVSRMENFAYTLAMMRLFNISRCFSLELREDEEQMILGFIPANPTIFKHIEHNETSELVNIEDCLTIDHETEFDQLNTKRKFPVFFNQELQRRIERAAVSGQAALGPYITWSDIT